MVVVSHLFFFLRKYFRGRCDSGESHRPLSGTIYFPTAPLLRLTQMYDRRKINRKDRCRETPGVHTNAARHPIVLSLAAGFNILYFPTHLFLLYPPE